MAKTYFPPSGQNYSGHVGKVVYKTGTNTVTLATNITTHKPCGVILGAVNATDGPVSVAEPGDRCFAVVDATATLVATTTFVCLGVNSGVTEETSTAYVVGHVVEPAPASLRTSGYIEIVFHPELNPAP